MPKQPRVSGRETVRALEKAGFYVRRQIGSHIHLRRDQPYAKVVVPNHREIKQGTLHQILKDAGLSIEQFIDLL